MKNLFLMTACAAFVVGASIPVFAADDPASAEATQPQSMSHPSAASPRTAKRVGNHLANDQERLATEALNTLADHGYVEFSNFHKKGNEFEADVTQDGKSMQVLINPTEGSVTQEM